MRNWIKSKRQKLRTKRRQFKDSLRGRAVKMLGLTSEDIINIIESQDFRESNVFDTIVDEAADKAVESVSISAVGDYLSDDIQNWITLDYSAIAENICLPSLAYEIDWADLASHIDGADVASYIDASEVAEHIDADDVAVYIDKDALAVYVVQKIGELLASKANSIV